MTKTKILIIFGTRPEAIKMAPVIQLLKKSDKFETVVCVTGQHRGMLDQALNLFNITPDIDLDIMRRCQDVTDITAGVIIGLREIIKEQSPDLVLVHGDTTSAMAASLAAFYAKVKVGHVEAGLRSFNMYSPWPEEMNRKIISNIASIHFAPTEMNRKNLITEGCRDEQVFVTGNTGIDTLRQVVSQIDNGNLKPMQNKEVDTAILSGKKIILVTAHRRENLGEGIKNICTAIAELAKNPDLFFVFPVHLNPAIQRVVSESLSGCKNLLLTPPLDYINFVNLISKSFVILTDSGGIQEEAPALGKPVLVLRDTTERSEAISSGTVKLIGTNPDRICKEVNSLVCCEKTYNRMLETVNPYGDGQASQRILEIILKHKDEKYFERSTSVSPLR